MVVGSRARWLLVVLVRQAVYTRFKAPVKGNETLP